MAWLLAVGEPKNSNYDGTVRFVQIDGANIDDYAPNIDLGNAQGFSPSRRYLTVANNRVFVSGDYGACYSVDLVDCISADGDMANYAGVSGTSEFISTVWGLGDGFVAAGQARVYNSLNSAAGMVDTSYYQYYGGLLVSSDGVDFYERDISQYGNYPDRIIKGETGAFIAGVINNKTLPSEIWKSTDGIDWSALAISLNEFTKFDAAGTSNGIWGVYFSPGGLKYSDDDLATLKAMSAPAAFTRFWAFGETLYAAAGGMLYSSTDGTTWASLGNPLGSASSPIYDIANDGSTYMIVGLGKAATTTDFVTYTNFTDYAFNSHIIFGVAAIPAQPPKGTATIQGTLRLDTAAGPFAARKVYLYDYVTGKRISQTTSNGTTGAWTFTQVAPGEYFVVGVAQDDDLSIPRDFDALGVITVI